MLFTTCTFIKHTYLQFFYFNITCLGYLDIKEGISSEGKIIKSLDTSFDEVSIENLDQPEEGFSSTQGLYIHLTILNEGLGVVEYVYGLLHKHTNLISTGMYVYHNRLINIVNVAQLGCLPCIINSIKFGQTNHSMLIIMQAIY